MQTSAHERTQEMRYAGVAPRFLAMMIDLVLTVTFGVGCTVAIISSGTDPNPLLLILVMLLLMTPYIYFITLEAIYGRTLGKLLLGLQVLREDGTKIDTKASSIRNNTRFLGLVFGFVGIFVVWIVEAVQISKSPRKQRYGDRRAGTIVVKSR